jgi:hypothetical protein
LSAKMFTTNAEPEKSLSLAKSGHGLRKMRVLP